MPCLAFKCHFIVSTPKTLLSIKNSTNKNAAKTIKLEVSKKKLKLAKMLKFTRFSLKLGKKSIK